MHPDADWMRDHHPNSWRMRTTDRVRGVSLVGRVLEIHVVDSAERWIQTIVERLTQAQLLTEWQREQAEQGTILFRLTLTGALAETLFECLQVVAKFGRLSTPTRYQIRKNLVARLGQRHLRLVGCYTRRHIVLHRTAIVCLHLRRLLEMIMLPEHVIVAA